MSVSVEKQGRFFSIAMWPEEGESTPRLPFLQPGNFYTDIQGNCYRIMQSEVEEHRRGSYGAEEPYFSWEYVAERD